MARPQKKRFICRLPRHSSFLPEGTLPCDEVILSVDEYETIRIIDLEGATQEECARQMQIGRTTVQSIYNEARRKLADALVNGCRLLISGGDYELCSRYGHACGRGCGKSCCKKTKGGIHMKIAVTYDNGTIFQHFGHTETFKLYETADGKILSSEIVSTNGSGHGALAGFLREARVDTLICGGIGAGAQNALAQMGIRLYGGCSGNADDAVQALLAGTLSFNPNVQCNHHAHHGEGHSCGDEGHSCH